MRTLTIILTVLIGIFMSTTSNAFTLTSSAFSNQSTMPTEHTCDGKDISPPLTWSNPPAATKTFALILADPDAPRGTWYHWVLFNIPKNINGLPQGMETFSPGAITGLNSWEKKSYNGPCPPKGSKHRYIFTLYALDTSLSLPSNTDAIKLIKAMKNHTLGTAEIATLYQH